MSLGASVGVWRSCILSSERKEIPYIALPKNLSVPLTSMHKTTAPIQHAYTPSNYVIVIKMVADKDAHQFKGILCSWPKGMEQFATVAA